MNGYIIVIALYSLVLILIGTIMSKKVKTTDDFFVGGRKFGSLLLFITLIAPNIGAGSTVGVAGLGFKSGLSAAWWIIASAIGTLFLAFIIGPAIWRLAKKYNFYTLGDFLEYRYNRNFRGLISLFMAIGTIAIFSGQLMGIAWILSTVADVSKNTGVLIAAIVIVLYFCAGGLLSAAYVNIIEVIVKLIGFCIAIPFVFHFVGGWSGLESKIAVNLGSSLQENNYFSMTGLGSSAIMGFFLMLTPAFFISPALIGKIYGAKNEKTVRRSTCLCGIVMLFFAVIPVILGMAAFAINPDLAQPDLALPYVMKECMPFWASAFALAAIFSAEISAADAVLYMITTSFTKDIYKSFINPGISDERLLKSTRIITVITGIIGVGMAMILPNVISALSIFYALMSVSLTGPLLFGLFSKRTSTTSAFIAAIGGIIITIVLQFGNAGQGIWILNAQSTGILFTLLSMFSLLYLAPKRKSIKSDSATK